MAFLAPIVGAIAGFASAAAPVISAVAGVASIATALKKPKAVSGSADASTKAPPVVPLPDETGAASRLRLAQTRAARSNRRGLGSTLVGGQLGDTRAPSVAQPLVLGRV